MSESSKHQHVPIVSIGAMASRAINQADKWHLVSVHNRSFYCSDRDGNLICIGRNIGRGPFNLLCSGNKPWPGNRLSAGTTLSTVANKLIHESTGITFDIQGASSWDRSLYDTGDTGEHLEEDLHWLAYRAAENAPPESFGWLIQVLVSRDGAPNTAQKSTIMALLRRRLLAVTENTGRHSFSSISTTLETGQAAGLEKLIGLGHGLTPSGDDFLAGVVMGLFKMQKQRDAELLACNLYRAAHNRTTSVSLAFYRALAECRTTESHGLFLKTFGRAEREHRERCLNLVSSFGSTSGWDTLAGMVFGISLVMRPLITKRDNVMETTC